MPCRHGGISGIPRAKKNETRVLADYLHTYGEHSPTAAVGDYGYHVGLVLNTERIASRQAFLVAVGTAAVHSERDLPVGFFDGMAATPREAQMLAYRTNAERRKRRNMAKAARGLTGVLGA